ncbi:MAG TPA: FAD-dependent monooxygenase [Terricaulis sp.]|nr:FAD-dependent monooxygenase [Terricaulis sp.]
MSQDDARIVIVGAGPVGLTLAYRLHIFGVPCLVLDENPAAPDDLRASTFHPPTLDMLDEYGLAAPLLEQGLPAPTWQIRMHETGARAVFDLSVIADKTRHPYRLQCEQFRLVRLLEERLASSGVAEIRRGYRVEAATQDDRGVTVRGVGPDGAAFSARGLILVGADGAHSIVRRSMDFHLEGETYPETTVLATTPFRFEDHLEGLSNVNYVWRAGGTYSLLRLRDKWRCSLYPDPDETIEGMLQPEVIEKHLQRIVPKDTPYDVIDLRPYRVHMRIVEEYSLGRMVLAGDAAHINSPSGGMGMNGGVHDAFNLSEKLLQIWNGASLDLLDLYTRQRRPVAEEEILGQAHKNRARMQERDQDRREELLAEQQRIAGDPERARARLLQSSMIIGLERAAAIQ